MLLYFVKCKNARILLLYYVYMHVLTMRGVGEAVAPSPLNLPLLVISVAFNKKFIC